jgi:DNA-directed RNA polymerase specialized sigma24 family protein
MGQWDFRKVRRLRPPSSARRSVGLPSFERRPRFIAGDQLDSMDTHHPVMVWLSQLERGDADAAQRLWEVYYGRMVDLAKLKLQGMARRAADEEDVALSAFKSFCRGAREGRFPQVHDGDNLWPLLMSLTAHKAIDLLRHERRIKRGGPGVHGASTNTEKTAGEPDWSQIIGREPTPEFAFQIAEECQRLLDQLSDSILRAIAVWKMEGYTTEEIAAKLGCVPRTVERKLQVIRKLWGDEGLIP